MCRIRHRKMFYIFNYGMKRKELKFTQAHKSIAVKSYKQIFTVLYVVYNQPFLSCVL